MRGKRKFSATRKEKQTIRTRLLEISMKVDDCVYHKKTISEVEAELFMTEVTSYKAKCRDDERSLQVIEKLVRCMKAIISEHQETRSKDSVSDNDLSYCYNDNHGAPSPAYSLPDEDRTQFTQVHEKTSVDTSGVNDSVYSNSENNKTQYDKNVENNITNKNDELTDIIYLCDGDDQELIETGVTNFDKNASSDFNTDINIHKALSNLSISVLNDEDDHGIDFSQSVLNNFQGINQFEKNTSNLAYFADVHNKDANKSKITEEVDNIRDQNSTMYNNQAITNDKEIPIAPTMLTNIECSQNILDNFKDINKFQQNDSKNIQAFNKTTNNITNQTSNLERKITNENVTQWNVKDDRVINKNNSNDPLVAKVSKAINNTYFFGKPPIAIQTSSFPNIFCKETANSIVNNSVNNIPQNDAAITNENQDNRQITDNEYNSYKEPNNIPKTINNINKTLPKRGKKSKQIGNQNNTGIVKKKRAPRKKNEQKSKEITNTIDLTEVNKTNQKTTQIRANIISKKNKYDKNNILKERRIPIYNRNVENDLSWLENIRFVREIDNEEYDRSFTNVSENFWENFELPPNFDENDFLCY